MIAITRLAAAVALTVGIAPLMYFLRATSPHVWVRRGLLVMMLLTAISAIGSQSRGALLAIASITMALIAMRLPTPRAG